MSYYHLTIDERSCILNLLEHGMSIRSIAKALQRSSSTISREIKRNKVLLGSLGKVYKYFPIKAQKLYNQRRENCHRKSAINDETLVYIRNKISLHWSPEQISNRPTNEVTYVPSTSTIYRAIRENKIKSVSMKKLRRKGNFKRPAEKRGKFNDGGRTIKKRPNEIYKRAELGHWEGDTVESGRIDRTRKSKYCFVTLAERKSRYYIAILVPDRTSANVTPAIINALKDFPDDLVRSITFDRGKEFSGYEEIEKALDCRTFFCDPYCSWQKGTNENSNGLLREFYPKGMNLSEVCKDQLITNLDLLNNRPRKCIKYKTPYEVIHDN